MHPCRLPALEAVLCRAHDPPRPHRRSRGREPCARDGAGGLGRARRRGVPTRYVFDEGHHLFDAADSAFSAELSGIETAELRRWLLGAEGGRSRARGLRRRIEDLVAGLSALETPLEAALQAARALPPPGWSARPHDSRSDEARNWAASTAGRANPTEAFLRLARRQVLARVPGDGGRAGALECDLFPPGPGLTEAAERLARALARIAEPLTTLRERLTARLDDEAEDLDAATRNRIEATGARSAAARSIRCRAGRRCCARSRAATGTRHPPRPRPVPPPRPARGRRPRRRAAPALARPNRAVRDHARRPRARAARDLGHVAGQRRGRTGDRPGRPRSSGPARRICPRLPSARPSPARSTMRRKPAPSW